MKQQRRREWSLWLGLGLSCTAPERSVAPIAGSAPPPESVPAARSPEPAASAQEPAPLTRQQMLDAAPENLATSLTFEMNDLAIPDRQPHLERAVRAMKTQAAIGLVEIRGHADALEKNPEAISLGRAEAARSYLQAAGIAADRLTVRGFGAREPVTTADGPEDHARNRRVELHVVERDAR